MDLRLDANISDSFLTQNRPTFDENSAFVFNDERQQQQQLNLELNDNYFLSYTNLNSPVYSSSHPHHQHLVHHHQYQHYSHQQQQPFDTSNNQQVTQNCASSIGCWSPESNYGYANAMISYNQSSSSSSSTPSPCIKDALTYAETNNANSLLPQPKAATINSSVNTTLQTSQTTTPAYCNDEPAVQYTTHIIGGRVVKRRVTANKKERRRTLSINSAFSNLRDRIPNVPADTKLSKIKTLRLATSYISYLMSLLDENHVAGRKTQLLSCEDFKVDLQRFKGGHKLVDGNSLKPSKDFKDKIDEGLRMTKKSKGRTGWPQHVWRNELQQQEYNEA